MGTEYTLRCRGPFGLGNIDLEQEGFGPAPAPSPEHRTVAAIRYRDRLLAQDMPTLLGVVAMTASVSGEVSGFWLPELSVLRAEHGGDWAAALSGLQAKVAAMPPGEFEATLDGWEYRTEEW